MKLYMKKKLAAAVISTSMLLLSGAYSAEAAASANPAEYYVADKIKVEVKSVLNEKTANGTRIGVVFYLINQGGRATGLPEDAVRVKSDDGVEYTLRPSAANAKEILPKEKVELTYMVVVDRDDTFALTELSWVDENSFVYPRKVKTDLTIPIAGMEWHGDQSSVTSPEMVKTWGEAFKIPASSAALEYKTVSLSKQRTDKGNAMVLTLLAENTGDLKREIPDFRINGKSSKKVYTGKRVEQDAIILEPGDKQYIHYAIPADKYEELQSLYVLTPESFAADEKTSVDYTIGRLSIQLPGTGNAWNQAVSYERTLPIRFDPLSKLVPSNVSVSLDELQMHESSSEGFKTVVAKFRLQNRTDSPVPVPEFLTGLVSGSGYNYAGTRQNLTIQSLIPNINYVVYYYFVVPSTEQGDKLVMNILDGAAAAPYRIPLASLRTKVQSSSEDEQISLYPFDVKLNNWKIEANFVSSDWSYSNQLILDLDIPPSKSVVDQNFSNLQVEVTDKEGKVMASKNFSFTGADRLTKGDRFVPFKAKQFDHDYTVKFYEVIDTPFGEAKRLLKTVKQ